MFTRNRWLVVLFSTVLLVGLTASRVIAATLVSDQDMPVSGSVPNACTGNTDTFSDIVHVHAAVTLSPSGTVHAGINIHSSDLKLQDATVGACSGQASLSISINTTRAALPVVITQHLKAQFECPGSRRILRSILTVPLPPLSTTSTSAANRHCPGRRRVPILHLLRGGPRFRLTRGYCSPKTHVLMR